MKGLEARIAPSMMGAQTTPIICEDYAELCQTACIQTELYYVIAALCVLICLLIAVAFVLRRKYKQEQKLRLTMWKVKWEDISFSDNWRPAGVPENLEVSDKKQPTGGRGRLHTSTGYYKGHLVAVKQLRARRMSIPSICDLDQVFMLNNEHVCKFYGANYDSGYVTVLTEYCSRGSLQDLLRDHGEWDDVFKNSLLFDIVKGMMYLHSSTIRSHGNLKPSNCLIDSRFMVKITDFGMIGQRLKGRKKSLGEKSDPYYKKLWTAPELLRAIIPPNEGSPKGDVYSFAIIAQEVLYQRGVFYRREDSMCAEADIVQRVTTPKNDSEIFRPCLDDNDDVIIDQQWRKTLRKCWSEKAKERPGFHDIYQIAARLQKDNNLVDNLLQRLQQYSSRLEEQVEEKTEQYKAEKEKSDTLLYQMLPKPVAERLKLNTDVMPESYDSVTVYFSDIVGFSEICHDSEPLEVVKMLNDLYTMFDQIIEEFDVYKVETIGDAYMVVSGLPVRNGNLHAREIARMALSLVDSVTNFFVIQHMPEVKLKLRVGIHTGPVVAGVVGLKMPRYCLFGDTVNMAARMEQNGKELQIHVSPRTKEILDTFGSFRLVQRKDSVLLKGLGEWNTWWLTGERTAYDACSMASENQDLRSSLEGDEAVAGRLTSTCSTSGTFSIDTADDVTGNVFTTETETRERIASTDAEPPGASDRRYERRRSSVRNPPRYRRSVLSRTQKSRRVGTIKTPTLPLVTGSPNPGYKEFSSDGSHSDSEKCGAGSDDFYSPVVQVPVAEDETPHPAMLAVAVNVDDNLDDLVGRDSGVYMTFDNEVCSNGYVTEEV